MDEFATTTARRSSATGGVTSSAGYSVGTDLDSVEEIDAAQGDTAGNTVTFGGVQMFQTNSVTDSRTGAAPTPQSPPTGSEATNLHLEPTPSPFRSPSAPPNVANENKPEQKSEPGGVAQRPQINPDNVKDRSTIPKPYLNVVVIGHVDSGKSTVAGRIVYECDGIDEELMTKFEQEANEAGKSTFKYAWIMDKLQAERERGISIDTKLRRFETRQHYINIIDAPGHRDYVHNMITGSSQADVALLVVSAANKEFEEGVSKKGQTREHLQLAYTMGVKQLIVVVNKMDATEPPYSKDRYDEVVRNTELLVKKAGYDEETVVFLPISGWKGDNLVKRSENLPWFKIWRIDRKSGGTSGRTLLDAIDNMERPPRLSAERPLRIAVHSVYKLGNLGIVTAGRIHSGSVKPGMAITYGPIEVSTKVRAVQLHHDAVSEGIQGENVGLQVEDLDTQDVKKGFLCGETDRDPPRKVDEFTAQIVILNHETKIKKGFTPVLHCHTANVPCKFVTLRERCDRRTAACLETNPSSLGPGDAAVVDMTPTKPVCVETFFDYPSLGRFVLRDMKQTIAVGVIVDIPGRAPVLQTDDDKWAVESIHPYPIPAKRPTTQGGLSVSFSLPPGAEDRGLDDKPANILALVENDTDTFRTKSGNLETEL